jgi:hypothetical protein
MFSSDPLKNAQVVNKYDETKGSLDRIRVRFDQTVSNINGVRSEAATALKNVVTNEVAPRMSKAIQEFESLGAGIHLATSATLQANDEGLQATQKFRNMLA